MEKVDFMEKEKKGTERVEEQEPLRKTMYDKVVGKIPVREDEDTDEGKKVTRNWAVVRRGLVVVIAVAALVFIFTGLISGTKYNSYEVIEETGVKNTTMVDYVPYQNSLLKYSKDGATYVDEKGASVWTETFAMKMPAADVCGDYVAIADMNGNDVYIFNTEGKVSSVTMPYTICDIAVAGQGEFAVILEGKNENYINLYDRNGKQIAESKKAIDQSGYPLDVDLSENGEKMFSSYLAIDDKGGVKNKITASNFGEVGQNENADRIVGGYQFEDTLFPKVEFLDNNTVCAFGDNQFVIYSMKEKSSEKAVIKFDTEIQSVVFNSQYVGVVLVNEKENAQTPYVLKLYNTNGHEVLKKDIDFEYDTIRMSEEEIIFTGGTECRIYTMNGKEKFSYTFQHNVMDMVPTGYSRRYIVLYDNGSEVVRLKHQSVKE